MYPLGWDSKEVRHACDESDRFKLGKEAVKQTKLNLKNLPFNSCTDLIMVRLHHFVKIDFTKNFCNRKNLIESIN